MLHANAPLSIEGRRRLVERCQTRPIAHVAAEMGISRACASKWANRWRRHGDAGLLDRSPAPRRSPNATPARVVERIETWRRDYKWPAQRIADELADIEFSINRRTVTRHLARLGLGRRRFIDPGGDSNRKPGKITARWPGHMVHLDVKKVGRIPDGAEVGVSTAATAIRPRPPGERSQLARSADTPTCIRQSTAFPGSPTPSLSVTRRERPLRRSWPERRPGSQPTESTISTGSSQITVRAIALTTSLESSATRRGIRQPSRTRRGTTGKWSAISAFWPRSCSTPATSPARLPAQQRSRSGTSTTTTTDHTPGQAVGHQPHDSRQASPTSSPPTASSRCRGTADVAMDPEEARRRHARTDPAGSPA